MVTMNDVIAFIEKAMENKLNILVDEAYFGDYTSVHVYHNLDNAKVTFTYDSTETTHKFTVSVGRLNKIKIEVTEMEIAKFKLEALKAKEYSRNRAEDKFSTFLDGYNLSLL